MNFKTLTYKIVLYIYCFIYFSSCTAENNKTENDRINKYIMNTINKTEENNKKIEKKIQNLEKTDTTFMRKFKTIEPTNINPDTIIVLKYE